jgi:HD superfamily phosphohydrolase
VYWHHAVRSATTMFKRVVRAAIAGGMLDARWIGGSTDEALMEALRALGDQPLAERLQRRQLYKRVLDVPASEFVPGAGGWLADDPDLVARIEDRLAEEIGLAPGEVLLDFPRKPAMLASDVPVLTRGGVVAPARLGIQQVADDLHTAARRFRVYVSEPRSLSAARLRALAEARSEDLRTRLEEEQPFWS